MKNMKGDCIMKEFKEVYKCQYFVVEELAEGVYAALTEEEGGALSNSGVIDLGNRTLVFDTFLSTDAATKLREFAEEATGRKAFYVVNSHSHFDHILGNCAFNNDSVIISTQKIRSELEKHANEVADMKKDAPQIISSLKEKLEKENDEISKKMIERDIRYFEMAAREDFGLRLADITFEDSLELIGSSRKAVLIGSMNGHTESDIILYLPEEKTAFMGDLLFTSTHPWLGSGDPEQWVNSIHEFKKYDVHILVPGHGKTGSLHELSLIEEYINEIAVVAAGINEGRLKPEDINEMMMPQPFSYWKGNKFLPNVKFYSEYLKGCKG